MKKILVILGNPNLESLNAAMAEAYVSAARAAGAQVEYLPLIDLNFDPILRFGFSRKQALEPDLKRAQELILWADHLVWVYPSWWGSVPALLKGFIDRTFMPHFAFKYRENSPWWDKFLTNKTARIFITMDTPTIYNWLVYGNANINQIKTATLQFCGVSPVKVTKFGGVRGSSPEKRQKWLDEVRQIAQKEA